jgi:tetratricopeptide (TPR) repeat protein
MKYAVWYGSDFWKGLLIGNKGDVYYQMGQYDSAEVCLKYDYSTSVAAGQFDNAANTLQWLARLELRKGNASAALGMLRVAKGYLRQMPNPTYRANTLYTYTQVFSALAKADSMNLYMQQYQTLHDSIERVANNNRLEVVRMQLDNQANVNKIISLNKEKKRIAMIRNFIIAFVVLLAITGIVILNRQKLKLKNS